jgi:hypothetical protein
LTPDNTSAFKSKTGKIVRAYRYYDKRAIPDWIDPYVCEENRRLYFIKDFDSEDLERVTKNDYFIYDNGKVSLARKKDFINNYVALA